MRTYAVVALAVALGLAAGMPVATAADVPQDPPTWSVLLRGPFGTVAGGDPADPTVAAPDGRALDAWQREAALELLVDPPLDVATSVTIDATPSDGGPASVLAITDDRWVTGPGTPGEHIVVATIERDGLEAAAFAWRLAVPDRPGDIETLLTMPAVEASLTAASGTVTGERGHGCHVDRCQEVGFRPPATSMEPLVVALGEPVTLGLDDGSAIDRWDGRLEPQAGTAAETRFARAVFTEPTAAPVLTGLEPDEPGEWLLELRVDYDRERGWQWYLFRLVAE